jgi:hypothetical protein
MFSPLPIVCQHLISPGSPFAIIFVPPLCIFYPFHWSFPCIFHFFSFSFNFFFFSFPFLYPPPLTTSTKDICYLQSLLTLLLFFLDLILPWFQYWVFISCFLLPTMADNVSLFDWNSWDISHLTYGGNCNGKAALAANRIINPICNSSIIIISGWEQTSLLLCPADCAGHQSGPG